jgi:ferric-dicitrate binding protein FerR (iron transport regulator)
VNDEIDWNLLGKYFAGECSAEEAARVRAWVEADPARDVVLEELRQVWRATGGATPWGRSAPSASSGGSAS